LNQKRIMDGVPSDMASRSKDLGSWFPTLSAERSGKDGARGSWTYCCTGLVRRVGLAGLVAAQRRRAGLGRWVRTKPLRTRAKPCWGVRPVEAGFRAGEEVGFGVGDGGDQMVNRDGLAVEGSLFVGIGG